MDLCILAAGGLGLGLTLSLTSLALRADSTVAARRRATQWHHGSRPSVPRLGGAILVVAFLTIELLIRLLRPELRATTPGRDVVVLASVAMFGLGFWDDIRPLGPIRKLAVQILVAAAAWLAGIGIEVCKLPFTQATLQLGPWSPVLTIVWLVSLTNLINLADGIDGLAGGLCLTLMLLVAAVGHQNGNFEILACGMAGALAGFLRYNFAPARIYLGDGGAYFLGFQIGLYSIVNSHKGSEVAALVAPLFVLALPIADAAITITRRGLRGLPLFRPDRKHLHHRLIADGFSDRKVVVRMYGLYLLFLGMALAVVWSRGRWAPLLGVAAAVVLAACAGACGVTRRWFAVHRIVRGALSMRREVRYALCLSRWLELEGWRCSGPEELWLDLVFAAEKLGFESVELILNGESTSWGAERQGSRWLMHVYQCPNGGHGRLKLGASICRAADHSCDADARLVETLGDLLAEAWDKAAGQLQQRGIPLRFGTEATDSYEPEPVQDPSGKHALLERIPRLAPEPSLE